MVLLSLSKSLTSFGRVFTGSKGKHVDPSARDSIIQNGSLDDFSSQNFSEQFSEQGKGIKIPKKSSNAMKPCGQSVSALECDMIKLTMDKQSETACTPITGKRSKSKSQKKQSSSMYTIPLAYDIVEEPFKSSRGDKNAKLSKGQRSFTNSTPGTPPQLVSTKKDRVRKHSFVRQAEDTPNLTTMHKGDSEILTPHQGTTHGRAAYTQSMLATPTLERSSQSEISRPRRSSLVVERSIVSPTGSLHSNQSRDVEPNRSGSLSPALFAARTTNQGARFAGRVHQNKPQTNGWEADTRSLYGNDFSSNTLDDCGTIRRSNSVVDIQYTGGNDCSALSLQANSGLIFESPHPNLHRKPCQQQTNHQSFSALPDMLSLLNNESYSNVSWSAAPLPHQRNGFSNQDDILAQRQEDYNAARRYAHKRSVIDQILAGDYIAADDDDTLPVSRPSSPTANARRGSISSLSALPDETEESQFTLRLLSGAGQSTQEISEGQFARVLSSGAGCTPHQYRRHNSHGGRARVGAHRMQFTHLKRKSVDVSPGIRDRTPNRIRINPVPYVADTFRPSEYDRSSERRPPPTQESQNLIYAELMAYKFSEMPCHEASMHNMNVHLTKARGRQKEKQLRILAGVGFQSVPNAANMSI